MHLKHACLPISPPERGVKTANIIPKSPRLRKGGFSFYESSWRSSEKHGRITSPTTKKERWIMNAARYLFLLGLAGLLTGCVAPTDMGYVAPVEPVYATPVYNSSPAYYATPVSGYSTMTVYDGYHPGYGGPRYPHHRPPPHHGHRPGMHGGHGGHHGGGKSGGHKMTSGNNFKPPAKKPSVGRTPSGKGGSPRSTPPRAPRGAPRKGGGRKK